MSHTPQSRKGAGPPAVTPTAAPAAAASADKKAGLSSKVLSMKFMQRHAETQIRKTLEAEKTVAQQAQQWTTPVRAAHAIPSSSPFSPHFGLASPFPHAAAATGAAASPAAAAAASAAAFPFAAAFAVPAVSAARPGVFLDDQESSSASSAAAAASASGSDGAAAPLPAFIPGRRSYGSFNPKVEALVAEAQGACADAGRAAKLSRREQANSVSDESMAEHYVGLRGKAAQQTQGGGGGGAGAGQKKFKKGTFSGASSTKKHPRSDGDSQQASKKQKATHDAPNAAFKATPGKFMRPGAGNQ